MKKINFAGDRTLMQALHLAVHDYFEENKIARTGNWKLYIKTIFWFLTLTTSYTWLVFFTPESTGWQILLAISTGGSLAGIGFNVAHDAAHGSYSKKQWVNDLFSHSFELMGTSSKFWKVKHNVAHHTYTNIDGHDEDFDIEPMLRMSPNQHRYWFHRLQFIYAPILYLFVYIMWVWKNDFERKDKLKIASSEIKSFTNKDKLIFFISKGWWFAVFVVAPLVLIGLWKGLLLSFVIMFTCGLILGLVFQPAHVVTKTIFPIPNEEGTIQSGKAEHQIDTTCDFATRNPIVTWLVGGLNFQVEHHLFTGISHIHYPKIHKIVKEVCAEYGKPIHEYRSFFGAICSHFYLLYKLGKA
jgi:linoleoyl-CoA desaturase